MYFDFREEGSVLRGRLKVQDLNTSVSSLQLEWREFGGGREMMNYLVSLPSSVVSFEDNTYSLPHDFTASLLRRK